MPRPWIKKSVITPGKEQEAYDEINRVHDIVRLSYNDPRTYLTVVSQAREPRDGELRFDGQALQLVVGKTYKPLAFAGEAGLPQWLLDRISTFEDLLRSAKIPESDWSAYGGL